MFYKKSNRIPHRHTETVPIVFYDGDCQLCLFWFNWLTKKDPKQQLRYLSIHSTEAHNWFNRQSIELIPDTLYFAFQNNAFVRSTAIQEIIKVLSCCPVLRILLKICPRPLADFTYRIIAKNRHHFLRMSHARGSKQTDENSQCLR